jgi:hypothetical protein
MAEPLNKKRKLEEETTIDLTKDDDGKADDPKKRLEKLNREEMRLRERFQTIAKEREEIYAQIGMPLFFKVISVNNMPEASV